MRLGTLVGGGGYATNHDRWKYLHDDSIRAAR